MVDVPHILFKNVYVITDMGKFGRSLQSQKFSTLRSEALNSRIQARLCDRGFLGFSD